MQAQDNVPYNSIAKQLRLIAENRLKQDKEDVKRITQTAAKAANEGLFSIVWQNPLSKWVWNQLTEMDFDLEERVNADTAKTVEVIIRW